MIGKFADPSFNAIKISIPLLVHYLHIEGKNVEKDLVQSSFLNHCPSRVLTGDEVDKSESAILAVCSTLTLKEIRKQSYANLLYEEIRSGYAHEYKPGERADSSPMTMKSDAAVSYINIVDRPRRIHFHVNWISELTLSVAKAIDNMASTLPQPIPLDWWIYE